MMPSSQMDGIGLYACPIWADAIFSVKGICVFLFILILIIHIWGIWGVTTVNNFIQFYCICRKSTTEKKRNQPKVAGTDHAHGSRSQATDMVIGLFLFFSDQEL